MIAIGVSEGVTLLEFEGTGQEDQQSPPQEPQVHASREVPEDIEVDCLDHTSCNFVKGKPRSIVSLLISKIHLSIYIICIDALSLGVD
jgi:hypothetical protein